MNPKIELIWPLNEVHCTTLASHTVLQDAFRTFCEGNLGGVFAEQTVKASAHRTVFQDICRRNWTSIPSAGYNQDRSGLYLERI